MMQIKAMEKQHPGITKHIEHCEKEVIPPCPRCGSRNAAVVEVGFVGRVLAIAAVTAKVTVIANGPKPGRYWCRTCTLHLNNATSWLRRQ